MDEISIEEDSGGLGLRLMEHIMAILEERWGRFDASSSTTYLTLGISGGSLPRILGDGLRALMLCDSDATLQRRQQETWKTLWRHVVIVMCDERYVPYDHPDRNQRSIETEFLSLVKIYFDVQVCCLSMDYTIDRSIEDAAKHYEDQLRTLYSTIDDDYPSLDVVLLGLGPDGHTCSIFPEHDSFQQKTSLWVDSVRQSPKPPAERITLTLPVLQHAFTRIFVVTGENKAPVVRDILRNTPRRYGYPAGCLTPQRTYWYLDKPATQHLSS